MNRQTSTKQTKAQPNKKTAESAENISAMKRLFKIKAYKMTFHQISRHFVSGSFGLSTHRGSNILGRTGYHV